MYGVNINDKPRINVHMLNYIYNFGGKWVEIIWYKIFFYWVSKVFFDYELQNMLFIVPVILIWIVSGINFVLRKVGNSITSYEEIKQNGDDWELNITSTFKNAHLKFKLGEEFDETTLDGRKCKVSNEKIKMHSSTLTCTSLWWNSYKTKLFWRTRHFVLVYMVWTWLFKLFWSTRHVVF